MKHPDVPRPQGRHAAAGPGPAEAANPAVLEQASLEQVIGRLGPMAPHEVAILGLAVLDQLVAVHNRGMLHGDVRPGSVLLGPHDRITLAPPTLRSPAFTAPEGVTGPAADLWSLGATLYTAAEGRPPSPGGLLDRAGPITPVLLALLSGDPGQRPEPGALRMTLLDIARRRGDVYTPLPPVPADALPPPSRRMPSTPFPVGPFVPGAIIPAPAPFPAETTTSAPSPFPTETTAPPPSPFRPGAATPAPFPSGATGPAPFRPAPPGATDPAPHPSRANGPAPSPSGANGPAPLPSGATGPAPLPSETTGPIPLPSGATGPASFPSEAAGPAFRPAPPGATAPAPFGTATPASSPFHPGTAPAPSPSPSPVDRPGPPLPAPPFHPEATDPAPTPATPIYPGSTASAPPPFPSEPPPQAGSAPGPDSTAPAPPFPSERTGPVQRPLQPEAPVQGPWDLHERASTPRSTPRAAPPASAVPGSQEPPPVPPGNGSPGSSGFPHSSNFPYSPGSPGFPPDSAPPFGAPMPPSPTGPPGPARRTEPARRSTGVLVPRSIVGLTGGLLAAMAVTIGVLLAPMIGGSGAGGEESVSATGPAGAKGRFAAAPRACSLLDDRQADEVVPGFKSSEVEPSACEWLNQHDWRTPNSEKFDLRVRLIAQKRDGSEIKRAREYLSGKRKDFVDNAKHATPRPVPPQDLKGVGEDAFTTGVYSPINIYGGSYKVTVVLRVSNLIAEVQYERGSVKEDSDGRITQDALKVARWITESLKTRG